MQIESETMKMILLLTNKDDVTVDFIVKELKRQKLQYYRLNTEDIPEIIKIDFNMDNNKFMLYDLKKEIRVDLDEIDAVYFRRAQISELNYIDNITGPEKTYLRGELAYVLEGLYKLLENKYWINNVYRIREAENKIFQLQLAKNIGFKIPSAIISNNVESIEAMINLHDNDCIIKPIKSGNLKRDFYSRIIFTSQIREDFMKDKDRISSFPVYVQENIHKKYDLRCIVIGTKVYCAQIDSQCYEDSKIDWRKGKRCLEHKKYNLPIDIQEKCIQLTQRLGLNYSAIDLILDKKDQYFFLECNPNGQWAWLEVRLGFPLSRSIVNLLKYGSVK